MPKEKRNARDNLVIAPIPQARLGELMTGRYVGKIRVHSADTGDDWMVDPTTIEWLRIDVRVIQGGQVIH